MRQHTLLPTAYFSCFVPLPSVTNPLPPNTLYFLIVPVVYIAQVEPWALPFCYRKGAGAQEKVSHARECCVASCGKELSNSGKSSLWKRKRGSSTSWLTSPQSRKEWHFCAVCGHDNKQVNTDNLVQCKLIQYYSEQIWAILFWLQDITFRPEVPDFSKESAKYNMIRQYNISLL